MTNNEKNVESVAYFKAEDFLIAQKQKTLRVISTEIIVSIV